MIVMTIATIISAARPVTLPAALSIIVRLNEALRIRLLTLDTLNEALSDIEFYESVE